MAGLKVRFLIPAGSIGDRGPVPCGTVNVAPMRRRILHRSGTAAGVAGRDSSSIQNHGADCPAAVRVR
jgi:hypothetical protein